MKKLIVLLLVLSMILGLLVSAHAERESYIQLGEYNEEVVALHRKLADFGYYYLRPESPWSDKSEDALEILQENLDWEITGKVDNKEQLDVILSLDHVVGKNLAVGTSSEWSEWFTPEVNKENQTFTPFCAILGEKSIGDYYTCSVEVEFRDVQSINGQKFWFRSQGAVDDSWKIANPWNDYISLREVPQNGKYFFSATSRITENNVNAKEFRLGYRCDYWSKGSFRVRTVKVEKGSRVTE